jgi:hypothetical protein
MPMTKQSWLDDEAGVAASVRQGVELLRRGLRRPWLTLLVALLLATALGAALVLAKGAYAPRYVLRVIEADRDPTSMPRLKRQLADYVREAIFTSEPLYQVIRRHGLYPSLMGKNSRAALDSFREDISVDVYQNYFVEDRAPGEMPRTARVAITYRAEDRAVALAVTRDLGALIVRHELGARRKQAIEAAKDAELARDTLQRALQRRNGEVLAKQSQMEQAGAPDPRLQVELVGLLGSVGALEREAEAAERRAASLHLGAALERRGMGLYFEVVDDATLPGDGARLQKELLAAGLSFVLGLPFVAMAIGAFAPSGGDA